VSFTFVMDGLLFRVGSRCGARRELAYSFENGLADSGNRLSANQGSTVDVEMAG
jgi:hypothetical protein